MARKNVLVHKLLENQSLSSNFTTEPTMITYTDNISYQINCFTEDSVGTFAVEVSDDYSPGGPTYGSPNPGTWNPLTLGGPAPDPFVNADDAVINISLNQVPFNAIRISYTAGTPGTGTCDINIITKQIGG